jgi:hypothetical protein
MDLPKWGALCFGLVVGWMTCRVFHDARATDTKWLSTMIGTIAGGAITALFGSGASEMFGAYCIGLAIGFFLRPVFLWLGRWPDLLLVRPLDRWLGRRFGIASAPEGSPAEKDAVLDRGNR